MQLSRGMQATLKWIGIGALCLLSGTIGASFTTHFGTSSYTLSYADFISVMLTCLGVMLAIVTLFVGVLAVLGWTSIEARLRDHSIQYIGSELQEGKPLGELVRRAVREAVYEGVLPDDDPDEPFIEHDNPTDGQTQ